MSDMIRLRFTAIPPIGEIVTVRHTSHDERPYVVVGVEEDPHAVWEFEHFLPDEGGPEVRPQTVLAVLRRLP